MGGTKILSGSQSLSQWGSQSLSHPQHIAPRPADQYPDISLAPNNPGIAHPKIIIKSQDNYLLGKKRKKKKENVLEKVEMHTQC